jgi:hypothetical protein
VLSEFRRIFIKLTREDLGPFGEQLVSDFHHWYLKNACDPDLYWFSAFETANRVCFSYLISCIINKTKLKTKFRTKYYYFISEINISFLI